MFVLDWSVLQRQYSTLQLSWLPDGACLKVLHGEYKAPEDSFLKVSNFNDQWLSHYGCPQHFITLQSHPKPLELKILVERHLKDTAVEETLNVLLYHSNERIVYAIEPLQPINYSSYGEVVACSFLLPAQAEQQRYCLVLARQTVLPQSYFYTLSVIAEQEFKLTKLPLPTPAQTRFTGVYNYLNYG